MKRYESKFFEMANLTRGDTGLDYNIWISVSSGKEKHWARIKVKIEDELIPVSISDKPEIMVKGKVIKNFSKLKKFIILNKELLLDYWNSGGDMSLRNVFKNLKKI